jgi:hypothetical protein
MAKLFSTMCARNKVVPYFDLVRDYAGEFTSWNAWQNNAYRPSSVLFIPAGTHSAFGPDGTGSDGELSSAGTNGPGGAVTVLGAGTTATIITDMTTPLPTNTQPGQDGNGNGAQPNINTILTGATTATTKILNDCCQFRVNDWVMLCAYDMQSFGHPRNNHYFEFRKITAVDYATGTVTFDQGVKYDYLDTYPELQPGTRFLEDQGGCATMIKMSKKRWDCETLVKNLTMNSSSAFFGSTRVTKWENVTFSDWSAIPSLCAEWTAYNCVFDGAHGLEFDKSIETITFENCTVWDQITQQSSSIDDIYGINSFFFHMNGTPKRATFTDCTFGDLRLGPSAYGSGYSVTMTDCAVTTDFFTVARNTFLSDFASTTGGVLTIDFDSATPSDGDCLINLVPDSNCWYQFVKGTLGIIGPSFQITDVTYDSGTDLFTYTTTLDGTEGEWALAERIINHDCPDLTVTNCTGKIAFCSYAAAAGMALGEYFNSGSFTGTYTSSAPFISAPAMSLAAGFMRGDLVSLKLNVTKAFTGTGACKLCLFSTTNYPSSIAFVNTAGSGSVTWAPQFDLRSTGERVCTLTGTTGAAAGDVNPTVTAGARWWTSGDAIAYRLSNSIAAQDPSTYPEFTLEIILDQGIP